MSPDNSVFSLSWNISQIAASALVLLTLFPLYAHVCPATRGPTLAPILELSRTICSASSVFPSFGVRRRKDAGDFRGLGLVNHIRRLGCRLHGCCHQLLCHCQSEEVTPKKTFALILCPHGRGPNRKRCTRRNVAPATLSRTGCQIKLHVRTVCKRSLTHQQDPENAQRC